LIAGVRSISAGTGSSSGERLGDRAVGLDGVGPAPTFMTSAITGTNG
jgi:hypothetical protein